MRLWSITILLFQKNIWCTINNLLHSLLIWGQHFTLILASSLAFGSWKHLHMLLKYLPYCTLTHAITINITYIHINTCYITLPNLIYIYIFYLCREKFFSMYITITVKERGEIQLPRPPFTFWSPRTPAEHSWIP